MTGLLYFNSQILNEPDSAAMIRVFRCALSLALNVRYRSAANRSLPPCHCRDLLATCRGCPNHNRWYRPERALLPGNLRLRALRVLRGRLIRLRKRSDRGAKNNCNSNSFDERFHETTSRECLIRAADVTCRAADASSLGVDQARINPPFLNSVLLLTRQWRKPAHQGFAGVRRVRARGSSERKNPARIL